jgi:hypothetical protein
MYPKHLNQKIKMFRSQNQSPKKSIKTKLSTAFFGLHQNNLLRLFDLLLIYGTPKTAEKRGGWGSKGRTFIQKRSNFHTKKVELSYLIFSIMWITFLIFLALVLSL